MAALRSVLRAELGLADTSHAVTTPEASLPLAEPLLAAAEWHRVEQVLAPHALDLGFHQAIAQALVAASRASQLKAMATAADTVRVSALLEGSGIPHMVVKGVPLSIQTTGSPFGRRSADVDVLVDPSDLRRTVQVMAAAGMERHPDSPDPDSALFGLVQRTSKEALLYLDGRQVDVHWRLDQARSSLDWTLQELLESAAWVSIGDRQVATLSRSHGAIYNAAHATSDGWPRLRSVVDQARLLRGLDRARLADDAAGVAASRRLALGEAMADRLLGTSGVGSRVSRLASAIAARLWSRTLAGSDTQGGRGAGAMASFGLHVSSYDGLRPAVQRLETLVLPVEAINRRELGDAGDKHPWLYRAATPYFLPKRALTRRDPIAP